MDGNNDHCRQVVKAAQVFIKHMIDLRTCKQLDIKQLNDLSDMFPQLN